MKQTTASSLPFTVRAFGALGLAVLALAGLRAAAIAEDAPAPTLPDAINVADVAAEAESLIENNAEKLASADEYGKGKKLVEQQAAILAVLAQAVGLKESGVAWQPTAFEIRDASMVLAKAASYEDAQKAQAEITKLLGGESQGMANPIPWHDITGLGTIMKEVTKRNTLVRRPIIRKTTFDQGKEAGARSTAVLAVMLTAARDDTHEVENSEDIPVWQKFADEARDGLIELARVFKEGDQPEARTQFLAVSKSCKQCHDKFRPDATF